MLLEAFAAGAGAAGFRGGGTGAAGAAGLTGASGLFGALTGRGTTGAALLASGLPLGLTGFTTGFSGCRRPGGTFGPAFTSVRKTRRHLV